MRVGAPDTTVFLLDRLKGFLFVGDLTVYLAFGVALILILLLVDIPVSYTRKSSFLSGPKSMKSMSSFVLFYL